MSIRPSRCVLPICAAALLFACSSSNDGQPVVDLHPDGGEPAEAGGDLGTNETDAPHDAAPPGSGGSGGLSCSRRDELGGGRSSCVAKIGSVELKVMEGAPIAGRTGPRRLGLYLHGDGAAAHKNNGVLKAMIPWADPGYGLAVSVLAPNGCAWWQSPAHDCAGSTNEPDVAAQNAAALVTALEAIMKSYDVRTDGVRYYGSSGGSIFLTDEWIPLHGATYPGVFALNCGGVATARAYGWDASNGALRNKSPLFFTYGDQDFLLSDIEASVSAFERKAFSVTEKIIPGAAHCAFDGHGEAIAIWLANP